MGHRFVCTSPNSRFAEGAAAINGKVLSRIEVHGKNLFYFFSSDPAPATATDVVHIHFGMSGAFKVLALPGPEPRETTRLAMISQELGVVAHLSASEWASNLTPCPLPAHIHSLSPSSLCPRRCSDGGPRAPLALPRQDQQAGA